MRVRLDNCVDAVVRIMLDDEYLVDVLCVVIVVLGFVIVAAPVVIHRFLVLCFCFVVS